MIKRYIQTAALVLAYILGTAVSAPANPIVPGKSLHNVKIGETKAEIKQRLGEPHKIMTIANSECWEYALADRNIIYSLQWDKADRVHSINLLALSVPPNQRVQSWVRETNTATAQGITLGTPESTVIAKLGNPKMKNISTKTNTTTLKYYGLEVAVEDGYAFYFRVFSTENLNPAAFKTTPAASANKAKPAAPANKAKTAASANKAKTAASANKAKPAAAAGAKANASAWSSMAVRAGDGVGPIRLMQTREEVIKAAGKPSEIKNEGKSNCNYIYRIGKSEVSVYFIRYSLDGPLRVSLIFVRDRRDASNDSVTEIPGSFTTPEGVTLGTPVDKATAKLGKGYTYSKLPNGSIYRIDGSGIQVEVSLGFVKGFMIEKKK